MYIHGYTWLYMDIHGNAWIYLTIHGYICWYIGWYNNNLPALWYPLITLLKVHTHEMFNVQVRFNDSRAKERLLACILWISYLANQKGFTRPDIRIWIYRKVREIRFKIENLFLDQTSYLHTWKDHRCYGYITNRAFFRREDYKKYSFKGNGLVFSWC